MTLFPIYQHASTQSFSKMSTSNQPLEWTGRRRVCFDSDSTLPATQGQRSKDVSCSMGICKAALRHRSQGATVGGWLRSARQSGSSDGLRVCVI
jgi:hypothetical protein